ncbi:MAG: RIO1 family regulatory kinase/ATPase [Anaerolineales bacterium]
MDNLSKYYDELDDEGQFEEIHHPQTNKPKLDPQAVQQFIQRQDDARQTYSFTYKPARFEEGWLLDSLGYFFEQRWISDVLCKVKSGKEASVYLCHSGEQVKAPLIAAKVFRPRMLRNLKNDQLYRLDRAILDENGNRIIDLGMLKAQHKRSVYGEQIRHQSWIAYEFQSLRTLYAADADVPQPYEMSENAILMGYIGDETSAAPTLNTVALNQREVRQLYERLLRNVEVMLTNGIVHGDLSAYNVLYWEGEITLIDFPQVVSPGSHRNAYQIFSRDIARVCEYFVRQGLRTDPARLAADLWKKNGYCLRPEVHPGWLDANDPADRQYWQKNREEE